MSMTKIQKAAIVELFRREMSVRSLVKMRKHRGLSAWKTPEVEDAIRERLTDLKGFERAVLGNITKEQEAAIKAVGNGEWDTAKQKMITDFINQQIEKNQAVADWVVEQFRAEFDDAKVPVAYRQWLAWKWFFKIPGDD